jgi:hypothetical protein
MTRYEEIFARHLRMIVARTDNRLDEMGVLALCGTGLPGEYAEVLEEDVGTRDHLLEAGDFLWYSHLLAHKCGFSFLELVKLALGASFPSKQLRVSRQLDSFIIVGQISDMIKKIAVTKRKTLDDDAKKAIGIKIAASMSHLLTDFYVPLDSTETRLEKIADILLANIEKLEERSGEKYV